jgi:hypothetical protein
MAMRLVLAAITAFYVAASANATEPNTLSSEELAEGWILLFDGQTTFGWQPATKANWKVAQGVISASEGEPGLLCTTTEFGDYVLRVDFRSTPATNSGVFLRTPPVPKDPKSDCYELNIAAGDVSPFPTGSFVGRQKAEAVEHNTQWRTLQATCEGGRFSVQLDGQQVLDYTDPQPLGRGAIGLQFNQGPIEFRNVKLKPLGLKNLFEGRDLAGWKVTQGDRSQSIFSRNAAGELHVKNGPGELESGARFADFTLQVEVFSNGKHLNSGIFFRKVPGEFWQGYESQIQNGYKGGDRTQPVDCGTGGFYRRQNARKVVADDFTWFHKTLIVHGAHMAAWVNGYQVSDWTDTRPPAANPRQGLRTEAGTLSIQGHDATTDLSFRNLRAAEMPKR